MKEIEPTLSDEIKKLEDEQINIQRKINDLKLRNSNRIGIESLILKNLENNIINDAYFEEYDSFTLGGKGKAAKIYFKINSKPFIVDVFVSDFDRLHGEANKIIADAVLHELFNVIKR
jgi:hypothetical protein